MIFPLHVRTVTGLEATLAQELKDLGAKNIEIRNRVVLCAGDLELLYKANLWCRTAIRVLKPIASFPARNEKALYEGIRKIDWGKWMSPKGFLAIDSDVRSSFSSHSLFISQLAKDAIVDQFKEKTGQRPTVSLDAPDLRVVISLFQDNAQVFVDASGDSLHKRGYRGRTGEAPLSEVLAAGILKLTGWTPDVPLLDPMCGSGTILIEAGLIARNIAPGLMRRHFGFQKWPGYDKALFERLAQEARQKIDRTASATLLGVEVHSDIVAIAKENIERAGLSGLIRIERGDFFTWVGMPQRPGFLVTNPPYDERLSLNNVTKFYQQIGDRLKQAYAGWTAFILSGGLEAVKFIGLRTSQKLILYNGGLESRLLKYELRQSQGDKERVERREKNFLENPKRQKWNERAAVFGNRLRKNFKNLSKRAKDPSDLKVYDWDIPELPFTLELKGEELLFEEVPRNHDRNPMEQKAYIDLMVKTATDILKVDPKKVTLRTKPYSPAHP